MKVFEVVLGLLLLVASVSAVNQSFNMSSADGNFTVLGEGDCVSFFDGFGNTKEVCWDYPYYNETIQFQYEDVGKVENLNYSNEDIGLWVYNSAFPIINTTEVIDPEEVNEKYLDKYKLTIVGGGEKEEPVNCTQLLWKGINEEIPKGTCKSHADLGIVYCCERGSDIEPKSISFNKTDICGKNWDLPKDELCSSYGFYSCSACNVTNSSCPTPVTTVTPSNNSSSGDSGDLFLIFFFIFALIILGGLLWWGFFRNKEAPVNAQGDEMQ